jgi:hypothetical protein
LHCSTISKTFNFLLLICLLLRGKLSGTLAVILVG